MVPKHGRESGLVHGVFLVVWSICTLFCFGVMASGGPAGDAAHFLRAGIGGRARGMGGAFVAVADDVTAVYWNPAGIVQSPSLRLGTVYASRFGGLLTSHSMLISYGSEGLAVGAMYFNQDIYHLFSVGLAARWGDLRFGGTVKLYRFSAATESASGVGFDIGLLMPIGGGESPLMLGVVSRDLGWTRIGWKTPGIQAVDTAAWVTQLGLAFGEGFSWGRWLWSGMLEVALRRPPREGEGDYLERNLELFLSGGGEIAIGALSLRAGFGRFDPRGGRLPGLFTVGMGVEYGVLRLDIAWEYSSLGPSYTTALALVF